MTNKGLYNELIKALDDQRLDIEMELIPEDFKAAKLFVKRDWITVKEQYPEAMVVNFTEAGVEQFKTKPNPFKK